MRNRSLLMSAAVLFVVSPIFAYRAFATVTVVGGLSNFDCTNTTGKPENEFEIEFPSLDPAEIASFWANTPNYRGSGYGAPTESNTASTDGIAGHKSVFVDYKASGITTPTNFTEHFGVHFVNSLFTPANVLYAWKQNGVVTDVSLPTVSLSTAPNAAGGVTVTPTVTNTTGAPIIVQFRDSAMFDTGGVQLDSLTDTNLEVQAVETEAELGDNGTTTGIRLNPGEVLGVDGEAHGPTDSIITNPAAWLAANHGEIDALGQTAGVNGFQVDLNNPGDSIITTLRVTDLLGHPIANIFSALNTSSAPEPSSLGLLSAGMIALKIRRRGRA